MNRKERRAGIVPTCIHTKFLYKEKESLPVNIKEQEDGRITAFIQLEGYASTRVKDGSGDVIEPSGIDLSRFEAGNAPLKAMHGRGTLSNIGIIKEAKVDTNDFGLYIKAEAALDISKDSIGRPINNEDYVLYDRLMNGTVNGFSIGFHNIKERWDEEREVNVIYSLTLHEISIVDIPDNPLTLRKMLDIYHTQKDGEADILDSDTTTMSKKDLPVEDEKVETTKDLGGEGRSLGEMLIDAIRSKLGIEDGSSERVYICDIYPNDVVFNHYKLSEDNGFNIYYRIGYTIEEDEAILNGEAVVVEPKRSWIDVKNLLEAMEKAQSQTSEESGNADDEENPEEEAHQDADPEDKALEIQGKLESSENELSETKAKLAEAEEALVKAKDMFDQSVNHIRKLNKELEKFKKVKLETGLTYAEGEEKKLGNVAKAIEEGKKLY